MWLRWWKLSSVAVAIVSALALAGPAVSSSAESRSILTAADTVERPTIVRINEVRQKHGLKPLRFSFRLARAAEAHALSMAEDGFFSHESADGTVFWKRIARWYGSASFSHWTVGENLLWASPDVLPEEAVQMWLDSPGHRRVLLSSAWTQIGLSAVHVTNAPGVFGGMDVTIVAADFGARS
jgi:uncharacterized protein YkwD